MLEDSFFECISVIVEIMKGIGWVGEWYGELVLEFNFFYCFYFIVIIEMIYLVDFCDLSKFCNLKV